MFPTRLTTFWRLHVPVEIINSKIYSEKLPKKGIMFRNHIIKLLATAGSKHQHLRENPWIRNYEIEQLITGPPEIDRHGFSEGFSGDHR